MKIEKESKIYSCTNKNLLSTCAENITCLTYEF